MRAHQWRHQLISEALGGDYLGLEVRRLSLNEALIPAEVLIDQETEVEHTQCEVELTLEVTRGEPESVTRETLTLTSVGVGLIDASFEALAAHFGAEYPSLRSIRFASFEVRGVLEDEPKVGTDALCRARLIIENSERAPFEFEASERSMASVSLDVVVQALEHFINAERAFVRIYRALEDARSRGRHDLIERFTSQLSELVKTTSYTESIAQLRSQMNI
jgi:hypothetical protein